MHTRSKVASERPDMHACMRSCRLFVSSFMQAASGQSPVLSLPFTSHGGFIYIRVSISSGLVGKTNQTLLLVEDPRPVLLCARNRCRAGASGTDVVCELCSGCTTIWFLGSIHATDYFYDDNVSRFSATTTLLRRQHGRSVEFIHRHCRVSVSISSVYLPVLFSTSSLICMFRCSSKFV
jgi:hypothetical protein